MSLLLERASTLVPLLFQGINTLDRRSKCTDDSPYGYALPPARSSLIEKRNLLITGRNTVTERRSLTRLTRLLRLQPATLPHTELNISKQVQALLADLNMALYGQETKNDAKGQALRIVLSTHRLCQFLADKTLIFSSPCQGPSSNQR